MNSLESEISHLSEEYKKNLKEAYIYASDNSHFDDITLLHRLHNEAEKSLFQYTSKKVRLRRMALLFSMLIITMSYIIAILCFYTKSAESDFVLTTAITFSITSITAIYSYLFLFPFKEKKSRSIILKHELISTWNELENITRELTSIKETDRYVSPKFYLTQMGILSEDEQNNIMHLLSLRNKIVHFSDVHISDQEIIQVTESAKIIIKKLTDKISK